MTDQESTATTPLESAPPADQDGVWVSAEIKVTFAPAPYHNLSVQKSGGVTLRFDSDTTDSERVIRAINAKAELEAQLRAECWIDLRAQLSAWRDLYAEHLDIMGKTAAANAGKATPFPSVDQEMAQAPAQGNRASSVTRRAAPQGSAPKAQAPATRQTNEPVDWGVLRWPLKASTLGHGDRYGVVCDTYTFDGEKLVLYGPDSNHPKAYAQRKVDAETGKPLVFWTRAFGDWLPAEARSTMAKLPQGEMLVLIEGSEQGKATRDGNPYANLIGAMDCPAEYAIGGLPAENAVKPVPVYGGPLYEYFELFTGAEDDYDDPRDEWDEQPF